LSIIKDILNHMIYETTLIISPKIDQAGLEDFWKDLIKKTEEEHFVVEKQVKPYSRALAYPIKKHLRAYVGTIYFRESKELPTKIKEIFSNHQEILRFMLLALSELPKPKPSMHRVQAPVAGLNIKAPSRNTDLMQGDAQKEPAMKKEELLSRMSLAEEIDKKLDEILEDKIGF